MRGSKTVTPQAADVEYIPTAEGQPIDVLALFPSPAPLELDLGCGDGAFLSALAAEYPDRNFLGVERLRGRVASACRKIAARQLTNARILRVDIGAAVTSLLPAASVEVCHVMFPDPWPKRRHHRRRTVTSEFLEAVRRVLVPGGMMRLTTDDAPYFEQMQQAAAAVTSLAPVGEEDAQPLPKSTFEKRFDAQGLPSHRLVLRKVSPDR